MKLSAGWRGDRGQGLWGSNLRGAGRGALTPAGTRGAGHQRFFTRAAVGLQCGLSPGPHESLLGQLAPDSLWLRPHRVSLCPVAPPRGGWGTPASLPWLSATQEHPIKLSCFSWILVNREGSLAPHADHQGRHFCQPALGRPRRVRKQGGGAADRD